MECPSTVLAYVINIYVINIYVICIIYMIYILAN